MPFTDFEHDPDKPGVHWEHFVTALGVWVYMQDDEPSVASAAVIFNTSLGAVRNAVNEHPWLFDHWPDGETDPARQLIGTDGE